MRVRRIHQFFVHIGPYTATSRRVLAFPSSFAALRRAKPLAVLRPPSAGHQQSVQGRVCRFESRRPLSKPIEKAAMFFAVHFYDVCSSIFRFWCSDMADFRHPSYWVRAPESETYQPTFFSCGQPRSLSRPFLDPNGGFTYEHPSVSVCCSS